jgi:hypothetical protein
MPDEVSARLIVAERLSNGWRPSRTLEHTWVRGARNEREGDDITELVGGAETAPMSEAEEQVLIERSWSDG